MKKYQIGFNGIAVVEAESEDEAIAAFYNGDEVSSVYEVNRCESQDDIIKNTRDGWLPMYDFSLLSCIDFSGIFDKDDEGADMQEGEG